MKSKYFKNNNQFIITFFIVLFLLLITYLFPYTGDDWAWGSQFGLDQIASWFKNYNGRYAGNIIVTILTRSRLLRSIIMTLTILSIIYLIKNIVNKKKENLFYIALALFLTLPRPIFRQAIVWTSGFTNYAISIALTLIYIYINKDILTKNKENKSIKFCISIFILAFCSALFIENLTIYNIILSGSIIVFSQIKYKKISNINISYLSGAIIGAITMFSNSAYYNIAKNNDFYRTIPNGLSQKLLTALKNYFEVIQLEMIFNNIFINILITLLLTKLVYKFLRNSNNKKLKDITLVLVGINISSLLYTLIVTVNPTWSILLNYTIYFNGVISAVYFLSIIIITIITIQNKNIKTKLLFYLTSIVIMTIPLLFVTPIGSRCFFSTYIMFTLYIIELINYLVNDDILKYVTKLSLICLVVFGIYLLNIYSYIFGVDNKRINYVKERLLIENNAVIPILPYDEYLWMSTPAPLYNLDNSYKSFHKIDYKVEFQYATYEDWVKYVLK